MIKNDAANLEKYYPSTKQFCFFLLLLNEKRKLVVVLF